MHLKAKANIGVRFVLLQVLFQHGLGEEELVNMSSSPEKLIRNLYEHHSINKRSAGSRMMDKLPGRCIMAYNRIDYNKYNGYMFIMYN